MVEIEGNFGRRHVKVVGGTADIENIEDIIRKIEEIDESENTVSQLFDASRIAGSDHIVHSARLALDSLNRDRSFANSPRIELTCWVAGLRQINKSLERVGIDEGSQKVAVAVIGESEDEVEQSITEILDELEIFRDDDVLKIDDKKIEEMKGAFSIPDSQLEVSSLKDIILEKVALLSLDQ